jgi:hypothetical protein
MKYQSPFVVDIGGEGRHHDALNVNPRQTKSFGPDRGALIPRLIVGRAEATTLSNQCADLIIVERTPLSRLAIEEIKRIAKPGSLVVLRHARAFAMDPHELAKKVLEGEAQEGDCEIGTRSYSLKLPISVPRRQTRLHRTGGLHKLKLSLV